MSQQKPRLKLVNGTPLPLHIARLPTPSQLPWNTAVWPAGEGARYWTVERIAALKAANEATRRGRK